MHLSDDQKNSHYISNTVINTIYDASTILINICPLEIYHIYFWLVNFSRKKTIIIILCTMFPLWILNLFDSLFGKE